MVDLNKKSTITDVELLAKNFPVAEFIVQGLLPATGLAVLGGAPKMGKSIMMTDLGLAISTGSRFLNLFDVRPAEVIYLALEDTERSMQMRIKKMLPDCPGSGGIHFKFKMDDKKQTALTQLGNLLDKHKNVKIVIIDTIARFSKSYAGGQYAKQYDKFAELKGFADKRNILLLIVHHLRKAKSADPFEMLYGSNALAGAVDTMWVLQRERCNDHATLTVSGRDVPDEKLNIKLNETLLSWIVIDPMTTDLLSKELREVYNILLARKVTMTLAEISVASGLKKPVLSKYLKVLIELDYVERVAYGEYRIKNGKKKEDTDSLSRQRLIS